MRGCAFEERCSSRSTQPLRRFILLALFCAWTAIFQSREGMALDPAIAIDRYIKQSWNTESGLPQNAAHVLLQTRDGFLWVGTEAGLARFDGHQFRVFDRDTTPALAGSDIRCLEEDGSGALWVGTASGLTRLKNGRTRTFGSGDGVPDGAVRTMLR